MSICGSDTRRKSIVIGHICLETRQTKQNMFCFKADTGLEGS